MKPGNALSAKIIKDRADAEQIMRLGFGSRSSDMLASLEVKLAGWDTVDGVKTAKLE